MKAQRQVLVSIAAMLLVLSGVIAQACDGPPVFGDAEETSNNNAIEDQARVEADLIREFEQQYQIRLDPPLNVEAMAAEYTTKE